MTLRVVTPLVATLIIGGAWPAPATVFTVIGYYADWTAPRYPLADIPGGKLTHVNYAFGKIGSGAGPRAIEPLEYKKMATELDWVSAMTYDFHTGGVACGLQCSALQPRRPLASEAQSA